jgi:hypothetical protein
VLDVAAAVTEEGRQLSQDALIVLLLKIGIIAGFVSLITWVAVYTRLTRGAAWRNPIGRTLMVKSLLIAMLLVPSGLSLFLRLNRFTSHVAAWADVVLIGAIAPVMLWRSAVWVRVSRRELDEEDGNGGNS